MGKALINLAKPASPAQVRTCPPRLVVSPVVLAFRAQDYLQVLAVTPVVPALLRAQLYLLAPAVLAAVWALFPPRLAALGGLATDLNLRADPVFPATLIDLVV